MDKPIWELSPEEKKEEAKKPPLTSSEIKSPSIQIKNKYFFLSQSLVKEIIDQWDNPIEVCWKKIYHYFIAKDIKREATLPMMYGNYFESLVLGGNADRGKTNEDDIPQKKNGGKKIDQIRVETQAERAKKIIRDQNIIIDPGVNTQVPLARKLDPKSNVVLTSVIDMFPTILNIKGTDNVVGIDLKLTADVNSTFGKYCWGNPDYLDYIQADTYLYQIRNLDLTLSRELFPKYEAEVGYKTIINPTLINLINKDLITFIYWIFGYKKPEEQLHEQVKMIRRHYREPGVLDNRRQRENLIRYKRAFNQINHAKELKYPTNPKYDLCKDCSCRADKQGDCKLYNNIYES